MEGLNANPQGQGQQASQEPQGTPIIPSLDNMIPQYDVSGEVNPQQGQEPQGFQAQPPVDGNGQPQQKPANTPEQNSNQEQGQGQQEPSQQQDAGTSPIEEYSFLSGNGQGLTPQLLELRNNVFSLFGASSMDANGNLLDGSGRVVLSKANLDKYSETGEVLTDGNGNQLREDGTILRPIEDTSLNFVDATREMVESEFNFKLLDENGKPKVYENTVQGQTEMIKDVYNNGYINSIAEFLGANPQVKDFYYHLANGGQPDEYNFKPIDYSSIDIEKLDKAGKINLIKTSLEKQQVHNAASIIKTYELSSDEIVNQSAADALLTLGELTKKEREEREKAYNAHVAEEKANAERYWKDVKSAVENNKVANISIPDTEKEDFFKYLASPVTSNGLTQHMIDEDNQDLDTDLMVAYMRWKKFNLNDLIELRAKTGKIEALRQRFAGKVPNPRVSNEQRPTQSGSNPLDLSLDKILGNRQQ